MKKTIINYMCLLLIFSCIVIYAENIKPPTKENIKKALLEYYSVNPISYTDFAIKEFPIKADKYYSIYDLEILDIFVNIGFLVITESTEIKEQMNIITMEKEKKEYKLKIYDLTEKGKKFYDNNYGFKIGTVKINKIINFSKPAESRGFIITEVVYTFTVQNIESWIKDTQFYEKEFIQKYVNSIKTPIEKKAVLILTDKGWVHEKIFFKDI